MMMMQKLLPYRGQPLVVQFRASNRNVCIYAGGAIVREAGREVHWDGKGTRIDPIIAEITVRKCDPDTGIVLGEFYSETVSDPRLLAATLIQTLNALSLRVSQRILFDQVTYVTARGYVMQGQPINLNAVRPVNFLTIKTSVAPAIPPKPQPPKRAQGAKLAVILRSAKGTTELETVAVYDYIKGFYWPAEQIAARGIQRLQNVADAKETLNWCLGGDSSKYKFQWGITTKTGSEGTAYIFN